MDVTAVAPVLQFGISRFLQAHVDLFVSEALQKGEALGKIIVVQTTDNPESAKRVAALSSGQPYPVKVQGLWKAERLMKYVGHPPSSGLFTLIRSGRRCVGSLSATSESSSPIQATKDMCLALQMAQTCSSRELRPRQVFLQNCWCYCTIAESGIPKLRSAFFPANLLPAMEMHCVN